MKNIVIPAVKETPYFPSVDFDYEKGECSLAGESYMEDCFKFYNPLTDWLTEYCSKKTLSLSILGYTTLTHSRPG